MSGSIALLVQIGVLLLVIAVVVLAVIHIQLRTKLSAFMAGKDGASLEESLGSLIAKIRDIDLVLESHKEGLEVLDERVRKSIRAYSLVRYNAFANDGGAQSFASGLLDETKTGYILSVVAHRNHVSAYARPVTNGTPEGTLTTEEQRALAEAIAQLSQ